jgi:hypothetical protein
VTAHSGIVPTDSGIVTSHSGQTLKLGTMNRNGWARWTGMAGHDGPEYPTRAEEEDGSNDIYYENRADFVSGCPVPKIGQNSQAQVEFSRIDRSKGTGASYVMKYITKTMGSSLDSGGQEDWVDEANAGDKQCDTTARVDTFRSIWGINQGQLFGVAKCLTIWDEFRRMSEPPTHHLLRKLWTQARGGSNSGRIEKGAMQQGDAAAFLTTLGGLDAARSGCRKKSKRLVVGRLVEKGINRYGDEIKRTAGIILTIKERKKVKKITIDYVEIGRKVWRTVIHLVASVHTRLKK